MINAIATALIEEQKAGVNDSRQFTDRIQVHIDKLTAQAGMLRQMGENAIANGKATIAEADAIDAQVRDLETLAAWVLDSASVRAENIDKLLGVSQPLGNGLPQPALKAESDA